LCKSGADVTITGNINVCMCMTGVVRVFDCQIRHLLRPNECIFSFTCLQWSCNMLQMIWSARNGGTQAHLNEANEVFVSYLPLSHVAAQILDIFVPLIHGVTVYFAQPDALKVVTVRASLLTLFVVICGGLLLD
jgi:hypothetical protein